MWKLILTINYGLAFFLRRIRSVVKKVEFISDRVFCITLKGRWCDVIVVNTHAPTEDKDDDIKDSFHEELFDQLPVHHMKILLGEFNAEIGRNNISQPSIENDSVQPESNDNGIILANFPSI